MMHLRPVVEEDLPLILEWRNRPDVREKMYTSHVISEDEHFAYFERVKADPTKSYYICVGQDDVPVGVVSFVDIHTGNRTAFWGFYTGDPSRRGVGTQMGYLALTHAFGQMNLRKLNGEVLSTNMRSLRYHEKLGFQIEGIFKEHHLTSDGYADVYRLAIFKQDWEAKWKAATEARIENAVRRA